MSSAGHFSVTPLLLAFDVFNHLMHISAGLLLAWCTQPSQNLAPDRFPAKRQAWSWIQAPAISNADKMHSFVLVCN